VQGSLAPVTDPSKSVIPVAIPSAKDLVDFYSSSTDALNFDENKLKHQQKEVNKQLYLLQADLGKCVAENSTVKQYRMVSLYLEVLENPHEEEVCLYLSYFVSHASWTPSYDMCVESATKKLTLNYCGEVKKNTGEDWMDCEMTLSTAKPSIGESPHPLPKKSASFYVNQPQVCVQSSYLIFYD
jgi:uncharacterized protein (TIGR02231 family)